MLMDMTLRDFTALLASKEPAPGGGSTAALAGLFAASLGLMVVRLTVSKKAYQSMDAADKTAFETASVDLERLQTRLESLVDDDTAAYNGFLAVVRMPKDTDLERRERETAMTAAQSAIINVPLESCETCLAVLSALSPIVRLGNKNAVSDAAVGAGLAYAGLEGAAMNVTINLSSADETYRGELSGKTTEMIEKGAKLRDDIIEIANKRINGGKGV